ncbi:uncharacterized protein LOC119691501 [Plutella xylostella]|uniref:uncharacterized protein LOC119691501 n=1 Tax=Plutella xylostella TaxID=51655 RepID=UPI0018D02AE1|nr:uncharacterized protein LOC119691501 [Plutella xylostella]
MLMADHIDAIINKAYKNLGFVIRSCKPFKNLSSLKIVFCSYVRSTLEYASPVWSPQYIIYNSRLERLQKIFVDHLKYRSRKSFDSYEASCHEFGLLTLSERRQMMDMCLLHDIVRGGLDCPELVSRVQYRVPGRRTRHTPLLHVPLHRTNYAQNATLTRIPRIYNSTFSHIDLFTHTKSSFKTQIIKTILSN